MLKNSRYMQYVSAIAAALSMASSTMYVAWASPTLPTLTSDDSPIGITLTAEEASWVASSFLLGNIAGGLVAAALVETIGRKPILLISAIPIFVAWIAVVFAKSAGNLIAARVVAGIASGVVITAAPMYNGEIAEEDIRGKLGIISNLMVNLGVVFVLSVGPLVSYTVLAVSCSAIPATFLVLFSFAPESPYYLIKTGKRDLARVSLIRLCKNSADKKMIDDRLKLIESTVECDMQNRGTLWELLSNETYRKSLIIIFGLMTLLHFSGIAAIGAYMQTILELSQSTISVEVSIFICSLMKIVGVLISAFIIDKIGRKPLLITSALGCCIALTAEGAYFYLQDVVHAKLDYLSWLPTTALVLYLVMNAIGIFPMPYVLMGELFTTNVKGIALAGFTIYGAILAFLVTKFFSTISQTIGIYTMFWMYAGVCGLGAVFVCFVLPETKGKTFAEIQDMLNKHQKHQM